MKRPAKHLFSTIDARFAVTPPAENRPATLTGYAMVWNALSTDRGGYRVRLQPGSATFAKVVHAYYHHRSEDIIGTTENQTLRIELDDVGAKVTIALPDTTIGRDTYVNVRDKYVRGMSFAMVAMPWATSFTPDGGLKVVPIAGASTVTVESGETIVNVVGGFVVDEVTITPFPSFVETTVDVAPATLPTAAATYSDRTRQANQLERLRFQSLRLTGRGLPRVNI